MIKADDLSLIAYAVNDVMMEIEGRNYKNEYRSGMEIKITVSPEELYAIDRELYAAGNDGEEYGFVPADEVSISINRINFKLVKSNII